MPVHDDARAYLRFLQDQLRAWRPIEDPQEVLQPIAAHFRSHGYQDICIPNPRQDSFDEVVSQLFEAIRRVAPQTPDLSEIVVGSLPTGHLNALALRLPSGHGYIVAIENQLLHFAWMTAKAIAEVIAEDSEGNLLLRSAALAREKLVQIVRSYVTEGNLAAMPMFLPPPNRFWLAIELAYAFELFVVAHEVAHVTLGHLRTARQVEWVHPGGAALVLKPDHECELQADGVALLLTLRALAADGSPHPFALAGVELFFEGALAISRCIDAALGRSPMIRDLSHPPYSQRVSCLRVIVKEFHEESAPALLGVADLLRQPLRDAADDLIATYQSGGSSLVHPKFQ